MGIVGLVGTGDYPADIHVHRVTKRYSNGIEAVKNVSLDIRPGECMALVGPQGAGKTTLLSIIAGDESASAGEVTIDGKALGEHFSTESEGPARVRPVFRPDITVYENLAETLKSRGLGRRRIARAIRSAAETLGIEDLLERYPRNLSPVQKDRVLFAKVMVTPATAYLVDRPRLFPGTEADVERSIEALRGYRRATVVCATTEPQEAISLGGRIAVMYQGSVEQVGDARTILDDPHNLNVARIIAPNDSAFVGGEIVRGKLRLPEGEFTVPSHLREALRHYENRHVMFRVADERLSTEPRGSQSYVVSHEATTASPALLGILGLTQHAGHPRSLPFDPGRILAFAADTGDRIGSYPEVLAARPTGQARASAPDDPAQGTRSVNAWLIGTKPPIPVGQEVGVGFSIGPVVRDALASAAFSEPDWGGLEEMECDVVLLSDGCDVSPAGQKLLVPRLGPSPSLEFRIRALDSGPIALRFQIYLAAGSLLQELVTSIEALFQEAEVNA